MYLNTRVLQFRFLCSRGLANRIAGTYTFQRFYTNRNLLRLRDRGLLHAVFPDQCEVLQDWFSKKQCIYGGFDPTADSLHIGNLLVIMVLLHAQRAGHEVLALVGSATALVGDPSGRNTERQMLEKQVIRENAEKLEASLKRIFDNHNKYFWNDPQAKSPLTPLRYLASGDQHKSITKNYRVGRNTICKIIHETTRMIYEVLQPLYLQVPDNQRWKQISAKFETIWNLPICFRAMHGKHFFIPAPRNSGSTYYKYKGFHSVVMLATCDAEYNFTTITVGAAGLKSDGGIFRRSNLGKKSLSGNLDLPPASRVGNTPFIMPYVMVADAAFPMLPSLLKPYPRKNMTKEERIFNYRILNNMDWYLNWNVIDFLYKIGRNFRMGAMLSKKSVQTRLNCHEGMSFLEFSYQVFQAYDWFHLHEKFKCHLQVGGSDQMGNIHAGQELLSRNKVQCFGLMVPLITSESGDKLGKSAGNTIWLNPDKTSSFEFYQFFMKLPDSEIEKYLKLFTFLQLSDIENVMESHKNSSTSWIAQKKLAEELTLLVHGEAGLKSAKRATDILFGVNVEALALLTREELFAVFGQASTINMVLDPGISVLQMALQAKCFSSERDCRKIAAAGGLRVNFKKVENVDHVLIPGIHILPNGCSVIRVVHCLPNDLSQFPVQ